MSDEPTPEPDSRGPKERVYDEFCNPLIAQLIALAKQHGISLIVNMELDRREDGEMLQCTTIVGPIPVQPAVLKAALLLRPPSPAFTLLAARTTSWEVR